MQAMFQNEQFGFALLVAGSVVATVGGLWLIVRAFRTSVGWGLAVLFLPVVGPLAFLGKHFPRGKAPVSLILLGAILGFLPLVLNAAFGEKKAEKPILRTTGDRKEFTATNAINPGYELLPQNLDLEIINVTREDFTDDVAEKLRGMTKLKRLEMNDAKITDKTLTIVATLPNLEVLNVARVKGITEDGFKSTVLKMATLKEIDARGTAIPVAVLREWRNANPDRKTNPK